MTRPIAKRRGGPLYPSVGFVAVGVSALALLSAGPRLLGAGPFGGLALAWGLTNVFGFGLAYPTEQLLTRRGNAGVAHLMRKPLLLLAASGAVVAGLAPVFSHAGAAHGFRPFVATVVGAVVAWVALAAVRGRLAGAGDFGAYSAVLGVEAVSRVVLVGAAALDLGPRQPLLGCAIAVPIATSAAFGAIFHVRTAQPRASATLPYAEQAGFILVSLSFQACLNAPPLALGLHREISGAVIGQFVAASTYLRAPTVLIGGILAHTLVALSDAWGRDDRGDFARLRRRATRNLTWLIVVSAAVLLAASPVLLDVYYGKSFALSGHLLGALALSSVAAGMANLETQAIFAAGESIVAARCWLVGAVLTLGVFAFATHIDGWVDAGLLVGPAVVLVLVDISRRRKAIP